MIATSFLFVLILFSVIIEYSFHLIDITPLEDSHPPFPEGNLIKNLYFNNDKTREALDHYYNSTFSLRDLFVKTWNSFTVYVFLNHDKVYIGTDGWCFFSNYIREHIEREKDLQKNSAKMLAMFDKLELLLESNNIDCFVIIPPYKTRIYPEHFPGLPADFRHESTINKLLLSYLSNKPRIHYINIYQDLLENKNVGQLYFKGDTHWTELAGFIADDILMQNINILLHTSSPKLGFTATNELEKAKHSAEYTFMRGLSPLTEYTQKFYRPIKAQNKHLDNFMRWSFTNANGASLSKQSLIVSGDSFFHGFMDKDMLVENFHSVYFYNNDHTLAHDYNVPSDTRFLLLEMYDQNTTKLLTEAWWTDLFRLIDAISLAHKASQ